jgi:hypothetical protein
VALIVGAVGVANTQFLGESILLAAIGGISAGAHRGTADGMSGKLVGFRRGRDKGESMSTDLFRPQLGGAHHNAYVVEDVEATVKRLGDQLGAGPFFFIEGVPLENVRSRGEPAEFAHNSAFGACGGGVIELIQPVRLAPERVEERFSGPLPRSTTSPTSCRRRR